MEVKVFKIREQLLGVELGPQYRHEVKVSVKDVYDRILAHTTIPAGTRAQAIALREDPQRLPVRVFLCTTHRNRILTDLILI